MNYGAYYIGCLKKIGLYMGGGKDLLWQLVNVL